MIGAPADYLASCKTLARHYKIGCQPHRLIFEVACATTQLHADLLVEAQRYGQQ